LKNSKVFDGSIITDEHEAAIIIGDYSFNFDKKPIKYGKIVRITPLYFKKGKQDYFFAPLDIDFMMEGFRLFKMEKGAKKFYNVKDHYYNICQRLFSEKGEVINLARIVTDSPQMGNEKAGKGETKEDKFYKQISKRLEPGWCFCIDAEIETGAGMPDKEDVLFIPFGGEKSFFKMEVTKMDTVKFPYPGKFERKAPYLFCIGDCFVDAGILKKTQLVINHFESFRNLESKVKVTKKYSGLSKKDPEQLNRSSRYNLLQRGSVLYFENNEKLKEVATLIEEPTHCKIIGFNNILTNKL
jgi:hypothetical protein